MSDKPVNKSRRGAVKAMMGGLAAVPLMNLVGMPTAQAKDLSEKDLIPPNAVDEKDPIAKQMMYKHDAKVSEREKVKPAKVGKPPAEQICANCMFQQPVTEAKWVACQIFPNKLVNSEGWCNSWVEKPSA